MKNGNQQIGENILNKSSMFIKLNLGKRRRFTPFLYEAICNVKPLIELNAQQNARSRRKPKAIPISSQRGEKLAIE